MSFFDKFRYRFAQFMTGRYGGNDKLTRVLNITAIVLLVLSFIIRSPVITLLFYAVLIYELFRIFSRNVNARYAENQRFEVFWNRFTKEIRQGIARVKNMRDYKYFRCPNCKARLRLRRGSGEGTLTCGSCGEKFKAKA